MKFAEAAITATKNIVTFPLTRERREKDEVAFLPAALEIVETPPSPIGSDRRSPHRRCGKRKQRAQGPGVRYSAHISLDRTQIQLNDAVANLSAGMRPRWRSRRGRAR